MSDSKRGTLITVGAPKSAKCTVRKTLRLIINLDESNESKYPELNYRELVTTEEKKGRLVNVNGKTPGLDPFSDNDEDVERVARKFEQKYGGGGSYGKKRRPKKDDFADIGAGYDENDSFIDNTDGYDEMIPPECDTVLGGFYINSGSLEFKSVPENQLSHSDSEQVGGRRNKRRISSSSSEESSDSSSGSGSRDVKETKTVNGDVGHNTEHRKKKHKKEEIKAKRVKRKHSSVATSGKQTSDDNAHADSLDSTSCQSSVKHGPTSTDSAATSDSSRDVPESEVPSAALQIIADIKSSISTMKVANPQLFTESATVVNPLLVRLKTSLSNVDGQISKAAWKRVARLLHTSRDKISERLKSLATQDTAPVTTEPKIAATQPPTVNTPSVAASQPTEQPSNKRKKPSDNQLDVAKLSPQEKEKMIVDTLDRLKALIEERKPAMIASYKAECDRVQQERKKIQEANASDGAPIVEKRMPKRRFPWCTLSRNLLSRLATLAGEAEAPVLLAARALPLFPKGFVRMPTLLRQADLKIGEAKRPCASATTQPPANTLPIFSEPIQFPSSLTVTTTLKTSNKNETILVSSEKEKPVRDGNEKPEYVPPNSIGSITITPVANPKIEKTKESLIRVKSPASLIKEANDIAKKDKSKKDKKTPLHIETNFTVKDKPLSPKTVKSEDNIPRPGLIPVHLSPTFIKPEKRAPDLKKKKDVVIVSDVDPLSDIQEPVAVDDSSSDVEVIEDSKCASNVPLKSDCVKDADDGEADIDTIMRNLREMQDSQEPSVTSNSFSAAISNDQSSSSKTDGCKDSPD